MEQNNKIQQQQKGNNSYMQVIAHRGMSSVFPENTLQSIIAGLHYSDFVQFDVLLTKDNQVIVFHDRGLKRITNIGKIQKFKNRNKIQSLDDEDKKQNNWWVRDFSYKQIQQLVVKQPINYRPQLPRQFKINKLSQVVTQCIKMKKKKQIKDKLHSGLLIQLKSEVVNKTSQRDLILCDKVLEILKNFNLTTIQGCKQNNIPIVLQSFNIDMLQYMQTKCQNNFVQLYKKNIQISQQLLKKNYSRRVKGIGITQKNFQHSFKKQKNYIKNICDKFAYKIYYWTIKDDDQKIPFQCKSYQQVYKSLYNLGVTGFITQFPDKCKGYLKIQSIQYTISKQQLAEKCLRNQTSQQLLQQNNFKLSNKRTMCSQKQTTNQQIN